MPILNIWDAVAVDLLWRFAIATTLFARGFVCALEALSASTSMMDCSNGEDAVSRFQRHFVLALMMLIPLLMPAAAAGPPTNAPPGTICITPKGWCPAVKPGPSGAPCACQTPQGWVQGSLK